MNERAFQKYLATGEYVPTEDAAPTSLEAHDRRFHPNGFDPKKDHCEFREKQKKGDKADSSVPPVTTADKKKSWEREYDEVVAKYKGTDKWLKAPNGESTNLTERQWVQVRTPSFKAWFGDWEKDPANASKVIDSNGEPWVFYRGEDNETQFAVKKENTFYTDQEYNAREGYGEGGSVGAYFLNLRNPLSLIEEGSYNVWDKGKLIRFLTALTEYRKKKGRYCPDLAEMVRRDEYLFQRKTDDLIRTKSFIDQTQEDFEQNWKDVVEVAKSIGCDGLIGAQFYAREYLVFSPKNVKSATDNSGAFSPEKENIMDGAADAPRKPSLRDIAAAAMAEDEDLEAHDRRFHGGQFDPDTQTCGLREGMAKSDDADLLAKDVTFEDNDDNFSLLSGGVKIGGCNYTFGWPEDIEEEYSDSVEDFNSSALMSRLGFGGKVMNIEDVWVDEKFRNKGHSADILQHAIELAGRKGATGIVLRAHSDAGISTEVLEKIYSRHGFESVQQTDEDGTIMYRKMDENT